LQGAQTALDNLNQSLADRAIPAFRKRAVSKEKLDHKAKEIIKEVAAKAEPVKKKRVVKKTGTTKKTAPVKKTVSVKKESTSTSSRKKSPAKK
jgi:methionine synthase I (cobalamin-dependent)